MFEEFNGSNVILEIIIMFMLKRDTLFAFNLNKVFYVERLKENLISTSEIYDDNLSVKFFQNRCDGLNKEMKHIYFRYRIVNNCCAINLNPSTFLACISAKLDSIEL